MEKEILDFILNKVGYIATVSKEGVPNVGPKVTMRHFSGNILIWNETTCKHTKFNIEKTGKASVCFIAEVAQTGYRFTGRATILDKTSQLFELYSENAKNLGLKQPEHFGQLVVEQIYLLDRGSKAGTLLKNFA